MSTEDAVYDALQALIEERNELRESLLVQDDEKFDEACRLVHEFLSHERVRDQASGAVCYFCGTRLVSGKTQHDPHCVIDKAERFLRNYGYRV